MNELVHTAWTQGCTDNIAHCCASIDVADELRLPLACVGAFLEEDDPGGLQIMHIITHQRSV